MRRHTLFLALAVLVCSNAFLQMPAYANDEAQTFDIPAQPLATALRQFAEQTGLQLAFETSLTDGRTAPALKGNYTPNQALTALLKGTQLRYDYLDNRTVAVSSATKTTNNANTATGTGSAAIAADDSPKHFEIEAKPLANALLEFGVQSGLTVVAPTTLTAGKQATSVRGDLTPIDALGRLLKGSGLTFTRAADGTIAIQAINASGPVQASAGGSGLDSDLTGDPKAGEVVVTGSRIARPQYDSPAPVAVVTEKDIERSGLGRIFDLFEQMPQFGVGMGGQLPNSPDLGAQHVELRGIGWGRTLVLIDGQRRVSGSAIGGNTIDLSTIPSNMVKRVEVMTGGASAVYGADALAGVINILLKDDFDGVELDTRQSITSRGDAYNTSYNILLGGAIGERGHFTLSLSYNKNDPLLKSDRDFSAHWNAVTTNPANTGPNDGIYDNILYQDIRFPAQSYGGTFNINGVRYTYDGGVRPITNGGYLFGGVIGYGGGDGYNSADFSQLYAGTSATSALMHVIYGLTDEISLTSDLHITQSKAEEAYDPASSISPYVIYHQPGHDNPFIPTDVKALMDANGLTTLAVGRTDWDSSYRNGRAYRNLYTGTVRLEGPMTSNIRWKAFAQYGRFTVANHKDARIEARFMEAIDVIGGANGPMCASATARAAGCRPLNIFGPNAAASAPDALGYFRHDWAQNTTNRQSVFGAHLTGDLFDLPHGKAAFASGVEYRLESLYSQADGLATTGQLFGGITGANRTVSRYVTEGFGEIALPLLRDLPFAHYLEMNAAYRASDYETTGVVSTWNGGLVYAPIPDVRLRLSRSRSVGAPGLIDQYSPRVGSTTTISDPCDVSSVNANSNRAANCAALGIPVGWVDPLKTIPRLIYKGGNPDLVPETADTLTMGVVFQPRFIEGLSFSVDYWDIDITDAFNDVGLGNTLNGCVDGSILDDMLCRQITRRPDGAITTVNNLVLNFSAYKVRGVDMNLDYHHNAGTLWNQPLRLGASLLGTYNMRKKFIADPKNVSNALNSIGTPSTPRTLINLVGSADLGKFAASWTMRYTQASRQSLTVGPEYSAYINVPRQIYNDVHVSADFSDRLSLSLGINNVFDVTPPTPSTDARVFDVFGATYFLNAKIKW